MALGGGVVGDLTGFVAATYQRGVPFVQVPTTLLAQIDSSVGGKVAVNHPRGKNMIGAFYQPVRVLADLDTLETLPAREVSAGLAEVIKYGPIADDGFFSWLEAHLDELRALDRSALQHAVRRCCEIKASVVGQDEREAGQRAILNFGHTVGHALESETKYARFLHGEAVAFGMNAATRLAVTAAGLPHSTADRIIRVVDSLGPIPSLEGIEASRLLARLASDKKTLKGKVHFVLPTAVGEVKIVSGIPDEKVLAAIEESLHQVTA